MQPTTLWRHPDFLRFWSGEIISLFGSQVTELALPLTAIYLLRATPAQMGILTAAGSLPMLLSLFVGVWVDRLPRRPIMILSNLGSAVLLSSIPLLVIGVGLHIEYLYVLTFFAGLFALWFDTAYHAFFPALVPRNALTDGNSKLEIGRSLAQIVGPGIAVLLIEILTAPISIAIDAASFAISGLLLSSIRARSKTPPPLKQERNLRREIREGLEVVSQNPLLRSIAAASLTLNFFGGLHDALFLLYVIKIGLSPLYFGLYFAVSSLSGLVAALYGSRFSRRFGLGPMILLDTFLIGVSWLAFPLIGLFPALAFILLTVRAVSGGFANANYNIAVTSLSQAIVHERLLGRYSATIGFFTYGLLPLGALIGGVLGAAIGLQSTLVLAAVGSLTAFLWVFFSPLRTLRQPASTDDTRSSLSLADKQALEWELYRRAFEGNGTSRSIYVFGTRLDDWQRLLNSLQNSPYQVKLLDTERNIYVDLPLRADSLFAGNPALPYLLQVHIGSCMLHCHFFFPSEIEFTLDTQEVCDSYALTQIFDFMNGLGRLFEKDVVLTIGNMREWVLFRFDMQSKRVKAELSAYLTPALAK